MNSFIHEISDTSEIGWSMNNFKIELTINNLMIPVWMKRWIGLTTNCETGFRNQIN